MSLTVGIVASNSISYVENVFSNWEKQNIVVPLRDENDEYRISAAKVDKIIIPESFNYQKWCSRTFNQPDSNDTALIAFTSGTTGNPKGVKISHNNLAEVVGRLNRIMNVDNRIREYIGVPVFHSFGLGRCRAVSAAGGQFYIPPNGFDPKEISLMLQKSEINAVSAVPSLWRILLENKDLIINGNKVRWIEIGSQYMSKREKEELKTIFPEANIVQHYGLTEASRTTLLEISKIEGEELESVGKTFGDIEVRITEDNKIAIKGSHVASHYIIDGQTIPLKDSSGWYITNDLGEVKDGYIYYKGRSDDIINISGIKISPEQIETRIFPFVKESDRIAICRKDDPIRGDRILVALKRGGQDEPKKIYQLIMDELKMMEVFGSGIIDIIKVDEIPRTASGKVQRKKISHDYADTPSIDIEILIDSGEYIKPETETEKRLCEIYSSIIGFTKIGVNTNFFNIGGDSLKAVQIITQINNNFNKNYYLDILFKNPTIKELSTFINSHNEDTDYGIIKIKEGSGHNLFLIHDGEGEVMLYKNLSDSLNNSIAVYLVPPFRRHGLVTNHFSIEEMVNFFTDHILSIQNDGLFNLGGLCDGGELSYLIACELEQRGKSVNLVGLIDAGLPGIKKISDIRNRMNKIRNDKTEILSIPKLLRKSYNAFKYDLNEKKKAKEKDLIFNYLLNNTERKNIPERYKKLSFPDIYNRAIKNYKLPAFNGNLTLMKGCDGTGADTPMCKKIDDFYFGWKDFHIGNIDVYDVPGGHTSMLQNPNVKTISEIISKKILNL